MLQQALDALDADKNVVEYHMESCIYDVCATDTERIPILCAYLSDLAEDCSAIGMAINWRTDDLCRELFVFLFAEKCRYTKPF